MCVCVCFKRRLCHSKLVQLYGICTQCSPMYLVFELMENGCLSDYLKSRKGSLSADVMLSMCLDVCEGMAYLESSKFIHRDLVNQETFLFRSQHIVISLLWKRFGFIFCSFYNRLPGTASSQKTMRWRCQILVWRGRSALYHSDFTKSQGSYFNGTLNNSVWPDGTFFFCSLDLFSMISTQAHCAPSFL